MTDFEIKHAQERAKDLIINWRAGENTSDWIVSLLWQNWQIQLHYVEWVAERGNWPIDCAVADWIRVFRFTLIEAITPIEMWYLKTYCWPR